MVLPGPVVRELVPVAEWHWQFSWRDLRVGVSFERAMWQFNLPGLCVWCDRYYGHGDALPGIPAGAEIVTHPETRLSDLQAAGATVTLVPK